jgi:hypothetical protein
MMMGDYLQPEAAMHRSKIIAAMIQKMGVKK